MRITLDEAFAVNDQLRGFNLMDLPAETLHKILSFLPMHEIVYFACVCQRVSEPSKWPKV
jgi:hypothetical protein